MKLVYVVSPLRAKGNRTQAMNEKLAEDLCREVTAQGHAPFAPHLLYTRFLKDTDPEQRQAGIDAGSAWLAVVDEIWVYGALGISEGMRAEIALGKALGKPVYYPSGWDVVR